MPVVTVTGWLERERVINAIHIGSVIRKNGIVRKGIIYMEHHERKHSSISCFTVIFNHNSARRRMRRDGAGEKERTRWLRADAVNAIIIHRSH